MRIELGNEKFIEVKEVSELTAGDKRAVKASVDIRIDPETGEQILPGDMQDRMNSALVSRIVTSWNLGLPPRKGDLTILDNLTIEEYGKVVDAIQPYREAINEAQADPSKPGTDPTVA